MGRWFFKKMRMFNICFMCDYIARDMGYMKLVLGKANLKSLHKIFRGTTKKCENKNLTFY